jgi:hypothetical protein
MLNELLQGVVSDQPIVVTTTDTGEASIAMSGSVEPKDYIIDTIPDTTLPGIEGQQPEPTNGILIFAIGHPYYGRYAFNLAVTLKAVESINIAVVHDRSSMSHLSGEQVALFDHMIYADLKPGCGAKLAAYDLSPFDRTLLLDADMLWLPGHKPSELFEKLKGVGFTGITEGSTMNPSSHYFFWAEVQDIRDKYNIDGVIHQWRTEVLYFERGETVANMFGKAKEIHKNHGLKNVKEFAEGVPDELAINIAAGCYGIEPHEPKWQPSYWPQLHRNQVPEFGTLYREYYLLSAGGNHNTENVKRVYNNIMIAQVAKLSLTHCFPLQSKHSFLTERRKS